MKQDIFEIWISEFATEFKTLSETVALAVDK